MIRMEGFFEGLSARNTNTTREDGEIASLLAREGSSQNIPPMEQRLTLPSIPLGLG